MNFVKYNPETKAIDLSTVFTSQVENSICIDGFDTSVLKPFLQPKEVDDLEKPIFEGEIVDYVLPESCFHDEGGFYYLDSFGEKHYEDMTGVEVPEGTLYSVGDIRNEKWFLQAKLLWIDGQVKAQKLSGYEKKTEWVLEEDESLKLPQAKAKRLAELSAESLMKADKIMLPYRKENVLFGVEGYTDPALKTSYANTMSAFRSAYYTAKALVDACNTIEEVNAITANFPEALL